MKDLTVKPLPDLADKARKADAAEQDAAALRAERDALALRLYEAGGVTYDDLAHAMSVTRERVKQVLQAQRRS